MKGIDSDIVIETSPGVTCLTYEPQKRVPSIVSHSIAKH